MTEPALTQSDMFKTWYHCSKLTYCFYSIVARTAMFVPLERPAAAHCPLPMNVLPRLNNQILLSFTCVYFSSSLTFT